MRRGWGGLCVLGAVLVACAAATVSFADIGQGGFSPRILSGSVMPPMLPEDRLAPVSVTIGGKVRADAGEPGAVLDRVTVDFDRRGAVVATGLPACPRSRIETLGTNAAKRACRDSIVGAGTARVAIGSTGSEPVSVPLTLFNGGAGSGATTLLAHASPATSALAPVVVTIGIRAIAEGPYGLRAVARIPPVADGDGSLRAFHLRTERLLRYEGERRVYAMAKCPYESSLRARMDYAFSEGEPRSGTIFRECSPRG